MDGHSSSIPKLALHAHFAVMLVDNISTSGQAQARAYTNPFGGEARIKDPVQIFTRNAPAAIGYANSHPVRFLPALDVNLPGPEIASMLFISRQVNS